MSNFTVTLLDGDTIDLTVTAPAEIDVIEVGTPGPQGIPGPTGPMGPSGGATWGVINGTLKDQSDLNYLVDGDGAYYFTNNASDLGAGRLEMTKAMAAGGGASVSFTGVGNGNYLASFCSVAGFPNADHLPAGPLSFNVVAAQPGGTQTAKLYAEFYIRTVGGSETLIGTSGLSEILTASPENVGALALMQPVRSMGLTDRLLIRIRAEVTNAGTAPDITLYFQGSYVSRAKFPSEPYVAPVSISWGGISGTLSDQTDLQSALDAKQDFISAANNQLLFQNDSSVVAGIPGFFIDGTTGGLNQNLTERPNGIGGGFSVDSMNVNFDPLQNSPDESWNLKNIQVFFDVNSSGFTQGTNGNAVNILNVGATHNGTGDIGSVNVLNSFVAIGNGTDPVSIKGFAYALGSSNINANVTLNGNLQGYGFQPYVNPAAIVANDIVAFFDYGNFPLTVNGYNSFTASPNILEISNNHNFNGLSINPTITTFTGNAGFTGVGIFPNIGSIDSSGSFQGLAINPTITLNNNSVTGLNVSVNNVTNYAGVKAQLVVQDITYEMLQAGTDGNNITVEYLNTTTAGNEVATLTGNQHIQVTIQSGVTTATQVLAAITAVPAIISNLSVLITGTGSNAQVTYAENNLSGGVQPGNKKAAQFDGDVQINGALSFTGALSLGSVNSFASVDISGFPGDVNSIDTLITQPTVPSNTTLLTDLLAINTAMLLNVGDNCALTSSFLGYVALGLPAVVSMGTGSTIDRVGGATFAISLDSGATGGVIDTVALCRALAIPNGITGVTRLYGYEFDLPFGDPGTDSWGLYCAPAVNNWMNGSLRIGGTTISDDKATAGYSLDNDGDALLRGKFQHNGSTLGFFNKPAVAQPTSSGAATAGALYTSTEQTMLQNVYDAALALGLMS